MSGLSHTVQFLSLPRILTYCKQGKLVKFVETNPALKIKDARDKDLSSMSVESLLSAHDTLHGSSNDKIHIWAACGTPRGAALSSFAEVGRACRARDIGITMHCAEVPRDLSIFSEVYAGRTPMQFCRDAELTGHKTVLAHMCHLDLEVDLPILRDTNTTVAHNPASNLKLASGIANVPRMMKAGINVALGTDGAPCNNSYDMLREMHLASILHKGATLDATVVKAYEALEMATIRGAKALGLEKNIGSIEAGKKADLVVLEVARVWAAPWNPDVTGGMDPVSLVVGTCTGRDVKHVLIDGTFVVENGHLCTADEDEIIRAAKEAIKGIQERSGIQFSTGTAGSY